MNSPDISLDSNVVPAMDTLEFLTFLRESDISLRLSGGQLQVNAPKKALTPELREQLALRKPEILAFLKQSMEGPASDALALGRISRDGALPLSFAQMRLWFSDQLSPGTAAYNIPLAVRLTGKFDMAL